VGQGAPNSRAPDEKTLSAAVLMQEEGATAAADDPVPLKEVASATLQ
jgi:hypothetical protein